MVRNSTPKPLATEAEGCPFVDGSHPCCRARFSLGNLEQAMGTCFGNYRSCSTHWELQQGTQQAPPESPPVIITLRRHAVHQRLRPTGS